MSRLLLLITSIASAPPMAQAQSPMDTALQHVPKDTALVVAIPDLHELAEGLAAFGQSAGIDELAKLEARDLLKEAFGENIEGLDPNGAFLLAIKPGQSDPLLIGTLTDPGAWKKSAQAEEMASGVLRFKRCGKPWYAGHADNAGMFARDEATLRAALTSDGDFLNHFAPQCHAMLADHQVVVWADVQAWRSFLEAFLTIGQGGMQMITAMTDPQAQGMISLWQWFFDQGRIFVREAEVYGAGMRFDAQGAFGEDLLTVQPNGKIADYLGKLSKPQADPLRALSGQPGMIVFALEWMVPEGTLSFSEAMLDAFLQSEQLRPILQDDEAQKSFEAAKNLYHRLTGYSGNFTQAKDGGMAATGLYIAREPEAAFKNFKGATGMWTNDEWMRMMSSHVTMEVTHRTQRVGQTSADAYTFSFKSPNEETQRALDAVYGQTMMFYTAPHAQGVAYAMGSSPDASDALAQMFDPNAAKLAHDPRITAARATIRPDPQFSVYLDIPKLADFGIGIIQKLGQSVPSTTQPQKDAPFVAFGIYLDPNAMYSEMFVPAASIKQAIDNFGPQDKNEDHAYQGHQ